MRIKMMIISHRNHNALNNFVRNSENTQDCLRSMSVIHFQTDLSVTPEQSAVNERRNQYSTTRLIGKKIRRTVTYVD